ncbi:MAG TPA: hypothetical protein VL461_12290 [Dictyobacter sp.]|jgi:hypothetical protein|nr:hypothetical protein [Dictyobacter sp.]
MSRNEAIQLGQQIANTTNNLKVQLFSKNGAYYLMLSRILVDPRDKEPLMWYIRKPADWVQVKLQMVGSKH